MDPAMSHDMTPTLLPMEDMVIIMIIIITQPTNTVCHSLDCHYHHSLLLFFNITEYGVHDPKTHDHKSQWEHRDGDKVHGEYTLDEADGTKRIVKYSSDKHGGFTAHVERVGHAHHPAHYHH
jgi:hypothetical protein